MWEHQYINSNFDLILYFLPNKKLGNTLSNVFLRSLIVEDKELLKSSYLCKSGEHFLSIINLVSI